MLGLYGMKKIIGIVIMSALIFGGWWYFTQTPTEPTITTEANAVAATVNGIEITGSDVRDQIAQITAYRNVRFFDMSDAARQQTYNEALDTLIQKEVLAQAVKNERISVSSEAIDTAVTAAFTTAGSQEALEAQLARLDKDVGDLRDEIKTGLLNEAYFNAKLPLEDITVSEEEVQERFTLWTQNAQAEGEPLPNFETDRSIIEAEIRGSKRENLIREHIDTLIAAAEIKKN